MTEKTQTDAAEAVSEDVTTEASVDQGLVYEFAYHLLPTLSEDETAKEVAGFKALIEKSGGTIVSEEETKPMQLAYTMVKKQEGKNAKFDSSIFGSLKFDAEAQALEDLKEEVDISKNVLRYLIIKTVREYDSVQSKPVFREVKTEDAKPISKPVMETPKEENAKPISEKDLDKSIEELVSEEPTKI